MAEKPCIIITRPIADASQTAELLAKNGFDYFIEPILTTQPIAANTQQLQKQISAHDGVIISSKNAARFLGAIPAQTRIISLGKSTSEFLKKNGFKNVEFAGQNIAELCQYIKTKYSNKKFIYASGESITTPLTKENCGNEITRIILYKTTPEAAFSKDFKEKFIAGNFGGILFFSKKTAEVFFSILQKESLTAYAANISAFCLSNNITEVVKNYGFKATMNPKNPRLDAIIKLLVKLQF